MLALFTSFKRNRPRLREAVALKAEVHAGDAKQQSFTPPFETLGDEGAPKYEGDQYRE